MTAQQTHEKNLAWIDVVIGGIEDFCARKKNDPSYKTVIKDWEIALKSYRANRKVLERHGPRARDWYDRPACGVCLDFPNGFDATPVTYPCSTTTDITEGLEIK